MQIKSVYKGSTKKNLLGPRGKVKHKSRLRIRKCKSRTQPAFTCSKLTIETIEQGVKYVQS